MIKSYLIDVTVWDDKAYLLFKDLDGNTLKLIDNYNPYFHIVCKENIEEVEHIVSKHPNIISTGIESKLLSTDRSNIHVIKVVVDSTFNFNKTIKNMVRVPGILELAGSKIPHAFQYVTDKKINFFHLHSIEEEENQLISINCLGEQGLPESDLDLHIIELSMTCNIRPKVVEETTPGSLNTFLHMSAAKRNNYLIPDTKKSMERPKNLKMLNIMDKGGLIFYPEPGIYSNVAKCDFASMYPNIIVNYNISPEMMHCDHADCHNVPEANWRICKNKKGIIPQGLESVLKRRLKLKKLMKQETDPIEKQRFHLRQSALKMLLVCSFGYLGFKNFIFSNVECKECVMLYGREILLRTKEIAEESGLDVIYGIVDSVFVKNGTKQAYQEFVKRISSEVGIELELDLIFRRIAFPCADDSSGIANKYYGISTEDEIECRGIALRHSDAPPIIKEFQKQAIMDIFEGKSAKETFKHYEELILKKQVPLEEFAITKSLTRDPGQYVVDAPHVVAFRQMPNNMKISEFVYTLRAPTPLSLAKKAEIKTAKYLEILKRSHQELIRGINEVKKEKTNLLDFC